MDQVKKTVKNGKSVLYKSFCLAVFLTIFCDCSALPEQLVIGRIEFCPMLYLQLEASLQDGFFKKSSSSVSREAVHFGKLYPLLEQRVLVELPIPDCIKTIRTQLCDLFKDELEGAEPEAFDNCIVTLYGPGDGIAPHVDRTREYAEKHNSIYYFADPIMGVILEPDTDQSLYFEDPERGQSSRFYFEEKRGTAFLMKGPLRNEWQHGLLLVAQQRISITFRKVLFTHNQK